jgi:hypothetical protein
MVWMIIIISKEIIQKSIDLFVIISSIREPELLSI